MEKVNLNIDTLLKEEPGKDGDGFETTYKFLESSEYKSPEDVMFGEVLIKQGEELRLVTGIVLEPETEDGQGDIYSADEIRKTAHQFMADYRGQGNGWMHQTYGHKDLHIVESYIAPVDFEANGQKVKKGTWLMSTLVLSDEIWKNVKEGKITGYSIRGRSNVREES
jgi:hypothetical protein